MRPKAIHCYVAIICALAVLSLGLTRWSELGGIPPGDRLGLVVLLAFGLLSERLSVGMTLVPRGAGHTITFIPLLATVVLFGPAAAVLLMAVTGGVAEVFFRRKEAIRAIFNVAQYTLATSLAGWAFYVSGGLAAFRLPSFPLQLLPFFFFLFVFLWINHGTVSLAIAVSEGLHIKHVWRRFLGPSGVNAIYDFLVSPLAIVVAFFYWEWGPIGLVVSLLPLFFIRHAYLNNFRLEQANRDLLRALVKAIETRDPYTSGHSQRVSKLAGRIARELNLGARKVEAVEMAALLHDVGKTDAVYTELLLKPHSLTPEERRTMESHVTKGVELLRSLATVPEEVILAVRHHHEREDGKGYPDGLIGSEIPLGAKIIKVCDAVDAMLSDRPYRAALSEARVRDELQDYAGKEFDIDVVRCILRSTLLQEHIKAIRDPESTRAEFVTRSGSVGGASLRPVRPRVAS